eukprot:Lankesteria_metandrocarpae@DN6500_c0_g1_i1.p1
MVPTFNCTLKARSRGIKFKFTENNKYVEKGTTQLHFDVIPKYNNTSQTISHVAHIIKRVIDTSNYPYLCSHITSHVAARTTGGATKKMEGGRNAWSMERRMLRTTIILQ